MRRRLSLYHKEASNFRDIADADVAEARSFQELLSKVHDIAKSNKNITSDLRTLLQKEKLAEDELRQQSQALRADLEVAQ